MPETDTQKRAFGRIYGLMAEFSTAEQLLEAARRTHDAGYLRIDAFSPFPIEGLAEAVGFRSTMLPLVVLVGGIIGCGTGYFLQYYAAAVSYPINVGGRPLNSWPAFIPITFELTVLFAAVSAVIGMLLMNGLPTIRCLTCHGSPWPPATVFSYASRPAIANSIWPKPGSSSKACIHAR